MFKTCKKDVRKEMNELVLVVIVNSIVYIKEMVWKSFIWTFYLNQSWSRDQIVCTNISHSNTQFLAEKTKKKLGERERVWLLTETVFQYSTIMLSSRRGHSIDVLDYLRMVLWVFHTDAFLRSWIFQTALDCTYRLI